jgi:hypothetical protein
LVSHGNECDDEEVGLKADSWNVMKAPSGEAIPRNTRNITVSGAMWDINTTISNPCNRTLNAKNTNATSSGQAPDSCGIFHGALEQYDCSIFGGIVPKIKLAIQL